MSSLKVLKTPNKQESHVRSILAVAAGKGGVGKSTVAVHLACALKKQGFKVGLLDADIYGPSLRQMLPEGMDPVENPEAPETLFPALTFGFPFISVAHFKKDAFVVRAPIANQIIEQFLTIVEWGDLDYLLIDFPPGTGDVQLTLMQKAKISGAVVVTTPQIVSTLDVRKAVQLFQKMEIPVIGIIENMSYFIHDEKQIFPFGSGGGESLAKEFSFPLLGKIPIDPNISMAGDNGKILFEMVPDSSSVKAFFSTIQNLLKEEKKLKKESLKIRFFDAHHLEIQVEKEWKKISLHKIQQHCPCAACATQKKSDKNVSLLEFSSVGRFAIKIIFSTGCSQGIYPFSLLKSLV